MPTISLKQAAQLWVQEGGPQSEAAMAAVVAKHESGLRTDVVNSIGATGLWQIHPGGEQYKDPHVNARTAVAKFKAAGGRWGPNPWQVCHDAKCSNLRGEATVQASLLGDILKGLQENSPGGGGPGDPLNDPNQGGGNALGIDLSGITDAIGNIARLLKGALQVIFQFLKKLSQQNTWIDAGKILLGLILLKMALSRLFQVAT